MGQRDGVAWGLFWNEGMGSCLTGGAAHEVCAVETQSLLLLGLAL